MCFSRRKTQYLKYLKYLKIFQNAYTGNRTRFYSLEGSNNDHYTMYAMVQGVGFEPTRNQSGDLKSPALNHSAILAYICIYTSLNHFSNIFQVFSRYGEIASCLLFKKSSSCFLVGLFLHNVWYSL